MYLRIETHKVGRAKMALTYKVASIVECESGWAEFTLEAVGELLRLQIGGDNIPDDAIGLLVRPQRGDPTQRKLPNEAVTAIDMMESLDNEVRAIMSNYFDADEQPQPLAELKLPMMMGFDNEEWPNN